MSDVINKELIEDVITDAINKVLDVKEQIANSDEVIPVADKVEPILDNDKPDDEVVTEENIETVEETPVDDETIVDESETTDVQKEVADVIEDTIGDKEQKYDFFGLDITIKPNADKWDITIKGGEELDNVEKTETIDSTELPVIMGIIEDFFDTAVATPEQLSGSVLDQEDELVDSELEEESEELEEDAKDEEESEDEDKEEDDDEEEEKLDIALASIRKNNKDAINNIFELGLMAKNVALDMVKEKILSSSVKELLANNRKADEELNSINEELKTACSEYILASKKYDGYKKALALVSSKLVSIKDDLKNENISKQEAIVATKICRDTIDKLLVNKSLEGILASIAYLEKMDKKKTIVASNKQVVRNSDKPEAKAKPVMAQKNIYNKNGILVNRTLNKNRRETELDSMIDEVAKLALG